MAYKNNPDEAIENIEGLVQNEIRRLQEKKFNNGITTYASENNYAWVVADLVKQKNSYYCGPAATLMAIDGMNKYVPGRNSAEKQDTIARQFSNGVTRSRGSYVYDITNVLNSYSKSTGYYKYRYRQGARISRNDFTNICFNSLDAGLAPVLHARNQHLSYYNGYSTGHYITVTGIDRNTGKIRLHDPNNSSRFHGIHRVNIGEAYNSVRHSGRYLISACL